MGKPSAETIRVLEGVIKHVLDEPRRVNMDHWMFKGVKSVEKAKNKGLPITRTSQLPPCGTVGCIAGWIVQRNLRKAKAIQTIIPYILGIPGLAEKIACGTTSRRESEA